MTAPGFLRLQAIAGLIRDLRLAELRQAQAARQQAQAQLDHLNRTPLIAADDLAAQRAALLYQGWAETRRKEIAVVLARQDAACAKARAAAAQAVGKAQVIDTLAARPKR